MTRVTQNRRMGFYCGPSIRVKQEKNVEIFNEKKDTLYYNQNNQIHQFLINWDLREIIQIVEKLKISAILFQIAGSM